MSIRFEDTVITCQTNAELTVTNATRETTCKDSGQWKEFLYGQTEWSMSGEALFSYDATYGGEEIFNIAAAQTLVTATMGTGVSGDNAWEGEALVTEWSISSPGMNENVTVSFSLQGTGALTMSS